MVWCMQLFYVLIKQSVFATNNMYLLLNSYSIIIITYLTYAIDTSLSKCKKWLSFLPYQFLLCISTRHQPKTSKLMAELHLKKRNDLLMRKINTTIIHIIIIFIIIIHIILFILLLIS